MGTLKKVEEITVNHPLEAVFDIEPNTTVITKEHRETELVVSAEYDAKDTEIEDTFQEVYDKAMDGFEILQDEMDKGDARFKARLGEVSVQHLNVALNAAKEKAGLKMHKDKLQVKTRAAGPKTVNNTLIVDRNELLRTINSTKDESDGS